MTLALLGGKPIRTRDFGLWPVFADAEVQQLNKVLQTRWWGGLRPDSELPQFEREFAQYHGVKYAVGVSNGTCALMLALKAVGVKPNDEVIVPAMSYIATATAVSLIGGIPVFADVDSSTHCLDVHQLAKAISDRTTAVIPVHLYGHPCSIDAIVQLAERHGLRVVEDCAQAHGAKWQGKKVGTFGDIGTFSFAQTKNVVSGEGGAVITNDARIARAAMQLRDHGRIPGDPEHHFKLGWNFRLAEFQAGVLRVQLERLDEHLSIKNRAAEFLNTELARLNYPWLTPLGKHPHVDSHGLFCFPMRYSPEKFANISRETICVALTAEGIPVSMRNRPPIYHHPIYQDKQCTDYCSCRILNCSNAESEYTKLILTGQAIGSAILLEPLAELRDVVSAIIKIADHQDELAKYNQHHTLAQSSLLT